MSNHIADIVAIMLIQYALVIILGLGAFACLYLYYSIFVDVRVRR